jgi:23S rRNA (uracil1939-C5)-methyltransferase
MEYSFSDQQWLTTPPSKGNAELTSPITNQESPISSAVFLGLHVPQRYDKVLDLEECHLQSTLSNRILTFTREFAKQNNLAVYDSNAETGYLRFLVIRESKRTNQMMVNLVTYSDDPEIMKTYTAQLLDQCPEVTTVVNTINAKKAQIAFGETERVYHGDGFILERLGKHQFKVSASSFFQTNVAQAEKLYQVAKEFGELKSTDVVYDLYTGTGSIALFVADEVKEVVGIESVESAIRDAKKNAVDNSITNCRFLLGDLKDRLTQDKDWMTSHPKPHVLIIDPPRSGMHPKVVEEIIAMDVERIVYVSCNPATQARDVQLLCKEKYQLIKLQPVDMFPHTYHIENVALLLRK